MCLTQCLIRSLCGHERFTFEFCRDDYRSTLDEMVNGTNGAKWAYKSSLPMRQRTKSLPDRVSEELLRMVRARSGAIFVERRLSDNEREIRRGTREASQLFIREQIAQLDGIQALYPENSLRELIVSDLSVELDRLDATSPEALTDKKLSDMSKLAADIQNRIERASAALPLYTQLLKRDNVLRLVSLVETQDDRRLLHDFVKTLPA